MYMYVCGMIYMLPWWPYQYTCKTVIYYFIFQHDGIAELPVELFYNNSLVSGTFKQKSTPTLTFWPNKAVVFCKVNGQEEWIKDPDSVDTSLCNRTDANVTVSVPDNLCLQVKR